MRRNEGGELINTTSPVPTTPASGGPAGENFSLGWICVLPASVWLTSLYAVGGFDGALQGHDIGFTVLRAVGPLAIALLVAILSFFMLGRSPRAGNLVFTCVVLFAAWHHGGFDALRAKAAQAQLAVRAFQEGGTFSSVERSVAENAGAILTGDEASRVAEVLRGSRSTADAEARSVARATAAMTETLEALKRNQEAAFRRLADAGGIDYATIRSRDDIQARRGLLAGADAATRSLADRAARLHSELAELLGVDNVPAARRTDLAHAAFPPAHVDALREVGRAQLALLDSMNAELELLDAAWGRWSVDRRTGDILFADPADLARWTAAGELLRRAMQDEERAMQSLAGVR